MQYKERLLSSFYLGTELWVRCPMSLPSRKVFDESRGRDEASWVKLLLYKENSEKNGRKEKLDLSTR